MTQEFTFLTSVLDDADEEVRGSLLWNSVLQGLLENWQDGYFYLTLELFWNSDFFQTSQEIMNSREASWNIRKVSEPSHKF